MDFLNQIAQPPGDRTFLAKTASQQPKKKKKEKEKKAIDTARVLYGQGGNA